MELADKTVLLIDDNTEVRNSLRIQLQDSGLSRCVAVRNIREAIVKIQAQKFDLIVCDYNLGPEADGQQFLELIRRKQMLPLTTAFMMVTGEVSYQRVSTAAEYSPDDYLLKPFTADKLATRLRRILEKKEALTPVYRHMTPRGDRQMAIEACDTLLKEKSEYAADILRLKGELLLQSGKIDDALALYDSILAQRSTPWALVGRGLALREKQEHEEATRQLEETLTVYPNYLAAYDVLADVLGETDKTAAQEVIERALKVSPSTQRQRNLGALAMENKDFRRAEIAYRSAVDRDRTGFFKSHDDYAALSRSCVEQGKHQEALVAVKDMGMHFSHTPDLKARQAALECQVHIRSGNPEAAEAAYTRALHFQREGGLNAETALEVAQSCFAMGQDAEAKHILQAVAEDHQENPQVLKRALGVFEAAGLAEEGGDFLAAASKNMVRLNNEAVSLAREGELDHAVSMLVEAAERLRNNAQVAINAAQAILMRISRRGMDVEQLALARRFIEQAAAVNPDHPKLPPVVSFYEKVAPPDSPRLNLGV